MKFKFKKIKDFFKKIPGILTKRPLLTVIFFLFLAIVLGVLIFYKYCFLVEKTAPQVLEKPLSFKEALFKEILDEWEEREENLELIEFKEYPDPFRRLVPELTD